MDQNYFSNSALRSQTQKHRVEIRKQKLEKILHTKRLNSYFLEKNDKLFDETPDNLRYLANLIKNNLKNENELLRIITRLRKNLVDFYENEERKKEYADFKIYFDFEIINNLFYLLENNENVNILKETSWCILIISSGSNENCKKLQSFNLIIIFTGFLDKYYKNFDLIEILFWTLGNMCVTIENRDEIIENDIVTKILFIFSHEQEIGTNLIITLLYLLERLLVDPIPNYKILKYLLEPLIFLSEIKNEEIRANSLKLISIMAGEKNNSNYISDLCEQESFLKDLAVGLFKENEKNLNLILKIVSNITFGGSSQNLVLFSTGILENLLTILHHTKTEQNKNILIIFSNFLCGDSENVEPFIFLQGIPKILSIINNSDFELKKDALNVMFNLIYSSNEIQFKKIFDSGFFPILLEEIKRDIFDINQIIEMLYVIEMFLKNEHFYLKNENFQEEKKDIKISLEKLMNHENKTIVMAVIRILNIFDY